MYFLFCILGFAVTLLAQYLFDTFIFELGKIGSSLLYLFGVFVLPKYLFRSWILRPNGRASRICNALYTEALVFLRSSNYSAGLSNISYVWMAMYFHSVASLDYESKTLAGHVILCYQKLISRELAPSMRTEQIQSHVNGIYDYMESKIPSNRYATYDTDCSPEAKSIAKLIDPDISCRDFSKRLIPFLEGAHSKIRSILRN